MLKAPLAQRIRMTAAWRDGTEPRPAPPEGLAVAVCTVCGVAAPPWFMATRVKCGPCHSRAAHERDVTRRYALPEGGYERLLEAQGHRCAICRCRAGSKRLAVDHDHGSGRVRGLLCSTCNHKLLGGGRDSLAVLKAAVAYLEDPPAFEVLNSSDAC